MGNGEYLCLWRRLIRSGVSDPSQPKRSLLVSRAHRFWVSSLVRFSFILLAYNYRYCCGTAGWPGDPEGNQARCQALRGIPRRHRPWELIGWFSLGRLMTEHNKINALSLISGNLIVLNYCNLVNFHLNRLMCLLWLWQRHNSVSDNNTSNCRP
jgi:hypothetical protein